MNSEQQTQTGGNPYVIPGAIVLAGIIIAGAVMFTSGGASAGERTIIAESNATQGQNSGSFGNNLSPTAKNVRPIDETDHVFGSRDAKIAIVEYSDFECPFCSRFHPILTQIVDEYAGEVQWVYRHFPLTSIHSRAQGASVASECVAELGGNDAFWKFGERVFNNQQQLGRDLYISIARDLGIDRATYELCLDSGKHAASIQEDGQNAVAAGGRGTPFSIIITENGEVFPFSGALPYEQVRQIIEAALKS